MGRLGIKGSYCVYGVCVRSVVPLPCPELAVSGNVVVDLISGSTSFFSRVRHEAGISSEKGDWFQHASLSDGSDYLQWSDLFEFLVSADGRQIACRELNGASPESFQTYLVGQVLSFALLKQGVEPLHATCVLIDGEAVAFLGDCGYGKSSLGACFLQVGYRLLTDDLLVLKEKGDRFVAYAGPPRIKLFPDIAKRLLGDRVNGTPMNNQTSKVVIPLGQNETVLPQGVFPLKAIYVLTAPRASSRSPRITIRSLSSRRAFFELIKNTFNTVVVEPQRLERQFHLATQLAARVPVKSLSFPRDLRQISKVRNAILQEVAR
ncbi:MAG: hypothetical protein ACE5JQ_16325 [Candidatus Methylomirabilales bacterium]